MAAAAREAPRPEPTGPTRTPVPSGRRSIVTEREEGVVVAYPTGWHYQFGDASARTQRQYSGHPPEDYDS